MRELSEAYDKCLADGTVVKLREVVNKGKVRKMLLLVEGLTAGRI